MAFFLCRLRPPRPTFGQDMSETEDALMREHAVYLGRLAERGLAVLFGPVVDPEGFWGLLVLETASEAEARELMDGDPVVRARLGFRYEVLPMLSATERSRPAPI